MVIGLIGMSGVGKTSWADKLVGAGFTCLHCDDLIATRLRDHGDIASGSIYDVGHWMGFPYQPHYDEREALYLAYETAVLREIADSLVQRTLSDHNIVIDMTGSAIYVDQKILNAIRQVATIIYLAAAPDNRQQMVQAYLAHPRPVLWNGLYQPYANESLTAALARCYAQLIAVRENLYEQLCDVQLDEALHRQPDFSVNAFLRYVEEARKQA